MSNVLSLGDVLSHVDDYPAEFALFLPQDGDEWNEGTRCLVADNSIEETDEVSAGTEQGLEYALGMDAVQDIVANVREQDPNVDLPTLVKAFLFYYDHDAFIELNSNKPN